MTVSTNKIHGIALMVSGLVTGLYAGWIIWSGKASLISWVFLVLALALLFGLLEDMD